MENAIWAIERELRVLKAQLASNEHLLKEVQMWRTHFLAQQVLPKGQQALSKLYGQFRFAKSEDVVRQGPEHWFEVLRSEISDDEGIRVAGVRADGFPGDPA